MNLESEECREALKKYEVTTSLEELAIKVLLAKDEEVVDIPGITEMDDIQIDFLAGTIRVIRKIIGITD